MAGGEHNILIYDMGGGTFAVPFLTIGDVIFDVTATARHTRSSGDGH